ncbi:hypothetical protein Tco_1061093 [Tanacetum coccineum]
MVRKEKTEEKKKMFRKSKELEEETTAMDMSMLISTSSERSLHTSSQNTAIRISGHTFRSTILSEIEGAPMVANHRRGNTFNGEYGEYHNSQWTLPPSWTESGVMLVLLADPGLWSDVISRWESITINRLNSQTWSDNKAKLAFVKNFLGESENLMWQQ